MSQAPWISHRQKGKETSRPAPAPRTTKKSGSSSGTKQSGSSSGRRAERVGRRPGTIEDIEIKDDPIRMYGSRDEEDLVEL